MYPLQNIKCVYVGPASSPFTTQLCRSQNRSSYHLLNPIASPLVFVAVFLNHRQTQLVFDSALCSRFCF